MMVAGSDGRRARVIGVFSGKGGVGKTTVVSNLSVALARKFKKRVLAVDTNITTANLAIHMGLHRAPVTLHDVLEDNLPINHSIYEAWGVDVIPAAHSIGSEKALRHFRTKLKPLLQDYDFVLLDSSPGLGLEARYSLRAADELLLITNPELSAVTEAIKMAELCKKSGIPVTGIVLNRRTGRNWEVEESDVEESCGIKVITTIPEDINVQKSLSLRTPLVVHNPTTPAARAFESLAATLTGHDERHGIMTALLKALERAKYSFSAVKGGISVALLGKVVKLPPYEIPISIAKAEVEGELDDNGGEEEEEEEFERAFAEAESEKLELLVAARDGETPRVQTMTGAEVKPEYGFPKWEVSEEDVERKPEGEMEKEKTGEPGKAQRQPSPSESGEGETESQQ